MKKEKGHRTFSRESALVALRQNRGIKINVREVNEKSITEIYVVDHDRVGNSTLGILDYLKGRHGIASFVEQGKDNRGRAQWVVL